MFLYYETSISGKVNLQMVKGQLMIYPKHLNFHHTTIGNQTLAR